MNNDKNSSRGLKCVHPPREALHFLLLALYLPFPSRPPTRRALRFPPNGDYYNINPEGICSWRFPAHPAPGHPGNGSANERVGASGAIGRLGGYSAGRLSSRPNLG